MRPYKFQLNLKSVLWGGDRIATFKGMHFDRSDVGESWEVSGIEGKESVVADGPDAGLNLRQLLEKYGSRIVGEHVYRRFGNEFPLVVKLIDARHDLSLQVHPDDKLAWQNHHCNGKTEMWYVVDADPGARLLAGMKKEITKQEYGRRIADNTILDVVSEHDTRAGDVFFLPAGRIHGIGAGNFIAEIHQASDITYRVYDYNRHDASGKLRELHTDWAADAIKFDDTDVKCQNFADKADATLVKCDCFEVSKLSVNGNRNVAMPHDAFLVVMCIGGSCTVTTGQNDVVSLRQGETVLIPAELTKFHLQGTATLLTATV